MCVLEGGALTGVEKRAVAEHLLPGHASSAARSRDPCPACPHPMHTKAETGPRQAMNLPPKLLVARHCHTARHTNQLAQMALRKTWRGHGGGKEWHEPSNDPLQHRNRSLRPPTSLNGAAVL